MRIKRTAQLASILALMLLSGCGSYKGRYADGNPNGRFIEIDSDSLSIGDDVDGSFVSNSGKGTLMIDSLTTTHWNVTLSKVQ
jgi:hypothetical protein